MDRFRRLRHHWRSSKRTVPLSPNTPSRVPGTVEGRTETASEHERILVERCPSPSPHPSSRHSQTSISGAAPASIPILTEDQNPAVSAISYQTTKPVLEASGAVHDEEPHTDSADPAPTENSTPSSPDPPRHQEREPPVEPPISPSTNQAECSCCENTSQTGLWFCGVCKLAFCDDCWDVQATHKAKSKALVPTPHEKTPLDIAEKVGKVLAPTEDVQQREELHRKDEDTAWFGIERRNDSSPLLLQDYGRLNDFLNKWELNKDLPTSGSRIPSLVSFVGETGAGKSSLVKLLIDFARNDRKIDYSTPVIGSRTDHLPTSEDVHLYLDPRTASGNHPILLADCEGLDGGDRDPEGAKLKALFRKEDEQTARNNDEFFKPQRVLYECALQWSMKGSMARSRGFAVTHVYPRLLYAFSDVIVYVLKNHRVIEKVFEQLIRWATNAIETSSNQPILPHAIIVLNASEHDNHRGFWDSELNTEEILASVSEVLDTNESFRSWVDSWMSRGRTIKTMKDLVLCYYSSIEIIRVPTDKMPSLVHEKVEQLYQSVSKACLASLEGRRRARMVLDIQDLQNYLRDAFSVFAESLDSSFDFGKAALRNAPIPAGFGANISKLLLAITNKWKDNHTVSADQILTELSYMVASCIMLDTVRHKNKGTALEIFLKYIGLLEDVLEPFCEEHWPCQQRHPRTQARCVNVRARHTKGHQTANGKVFAAGEYVSDFTLDEYRKEFLDNVYCCLIKFLDRLEKELKAKEGASERLVASSIHRDMVLAGFFRCVDPPEYRGHSGPLTSQSACFCCLLEAGQHPLPCGHLLCTECVMTFGTLDYTTSAVGLRECPIGSDTCSFTCFPAQIRMKPRSSGARVMSLDGGGIRGIVELEVLKCIEGALGGKLRIQSFFDLIVGTSAGGLIALGLGQMGWSVAECIERFEGLCKEIFTPRVAANLAIIGTFSESYHHSRYQTKPMERALKSAFSENGLLFGGVQAERPEFGNSALRLNIAVIAASVASNKAFVLSNYNRPANTNFPVGASYHFQRPERMSQELKIWEAARATSAAPQYFKEFHHGPSRRSYVDGAILHNNPVRIAELERRILWPEFHQPDVMLSIGTGCVEATDSATVTGHRTRKVLRMWSNWRRLFQILTNNMELALDCDRIWDEYYDLAGPPNPGPPSKRLFRINPVIRGALPALDDVDLMAKLQRDVREYLETAKPKIAEVARQLVASSFYFHVDSVEDGVLDRCRVRGKLSCRFLTQSEDLKHFGEYLTQRTKAEGPLFLVIHCSPPTKPPLAEVPLSGMVEAMKMGRLSPQSISFGKIRAVTTIQMELQFGKNESYLISGFPRFCSTSDLDSDCRDRQPRGDVCRHDHRHPPSSEETSSRRSRAIDWKPPRGLDGLPHIDLGHYADPKRTLGGWTLSSSQDLEWGSESGDDH